MTPFPEPRADDRLAPVPDAAAMRPRRFLLGTGALYGANMAFTVILTWSVLALSRSPLLAAVALILNGLPQVLTGILGPARMGARRGPSRLLVACGGCVLAMGGVALAGAAAPVLVGALLAAAVAEGLGNAAAIPVAQAWWMGLTPAAGKVRAARDYEIASRLPRILAPIAGAMLLAAGRLGPALLVTGLGLVASGVSWRGLVGQAAAADRALAWSEGLAALRQDRWLCAALVLRGVSNALWPAFTIGLPWMVLDRLHATATVYGVVTTVYGGSTIVLAFAAGRMSTARLRRWYMAAWAATGLGLVALARGDSVAAVLAAVVIVGIGSPMIHMALDAHIGSAVAQARQPSVFAFQRFVMGIAGLLGLYGVGWLLTVLSTTVVLTLTGALIVAAAGIAAIAAERGPGASLRAT